MVVLYLKVTVMGHLIAGALELIDMVVVVTVILCLQVYINIILHLLPLLFIAWDPI